MKIEIDEEKLKFIMHCYAMEAGYATMQKGCMSNIISYIKEVATKTALDHAKTITKNLTQK